MTIKHSVTPYYTHQNMRYNDTINAIIAMFITIL